MNQAMVDNIVRAVLYEGYILYPYRPSSVKNRQRWTFGGIYPRAFSDQQSGTDPWTMQTQCVVAGNEPTLQIKVRFLHLLDRKVEQATGDNEFRPVAVMEAAGRSYPSWQEAVEREVELGEVALADLSHPRCTVFSFAGGIEVQSLSEADGRPVGRVIREQQSISGSVELSAVRKAGDTFLVTVRILNQTPIDARAPIDRDAALMRSFASTHVMFSVRQGDFISLTDPPDGLREVVAECQNIGCWPVLVGEPDETDAMLSSPIILEDYPRIAPESPGDLFDGTEIDEILTLRILTLTDEEKRQAVAADHRAAEMFARTESLAREQLSNLHGVMRHG
ncbi:MAG: hypothetical protein JWO87_3285 [Phycisphaerales bacterium]|nr:hypothetical protein [Phycisphaerales bacterium]